MAERRKAMAAEKVRAAKKPSPSPRPASGGKFIDMVSAPVSGARPAHGSSSERARIETLERQRFYDSRGREVYEMDEYRQTSASVGPNNYRKEARSIRELRAEEEFIKSPEAINDAIFDSAPDRPVSRRASAEARFVDNANDIVDKRPLSPDFNSANRAQKALRSRPAPQPQSPSPRSDFPEEKKTSKIVSFFVVVAVIIVGAAVGAASYFFFFDR
jgi:hypothetical protein